MATLEQIEFALVNAHKAGDTDAARKLAAVAKAERIRRERGVVPAGTVQLDGEVFSIPDGPSQVDVAGTVSRNVQEPSLGDRLYGAAETGATLATGATTGAAGMIGGTLKALAEEVLSGKFGTSESADRVEQAAMEGMQSLTYAPRTRTGQEYTESVAEVLEPLEALGPALPQMGAAIGGGARQAALPARAITQARVIEPSARAIKKITPERKPSADLNLESRLSPEMQEMAELRTTQSESLPVPIKLTKGQRTRDFDQQRFEKEQAKMQDIGEPLRERFEEQNSQVIQNLDAFLDQTGGSADDIIGIGQSVTGAITKRAAKDKARYRALYQKAEKQGEMREEISLQPLADYLNENRASSVQDGIMEQLQRQINVLELGQGRFQNNTLKIPRATINQAENLRKFINARTRKISDKDQIAEGAKLKSVIDQTTEGSGGDVYKQARKARAKYANDYENIALIKQLMDKRKGGIDRVVALEEVLKRAVLRPGATLEEAKQLRRILQTQGKEGQQAWKDIQSGTLKYIKDQITKSVTTNSRGDPVVSPRALNNAINGLDANRRLDFIFGKEGAENLRTLNEVAKYALTSPPGVVNTSNTATVLAALVDVAMTGVSGIPAPLASFFRLAKDSIKDKKLRAQVQEALSEGE